MNYTILYQKIISKAVSQKRNRKDGNYYEKHHIIPRCIGGTNNSDNLVLLTPKEHFICHKILCEIYPNNIKIFYGYFSMAMMKKDIHKKFFNISSREYDYLRKEHIKNIKGSGNPMYGKEGYFKNKFGKDHPAFGRYFDHRGEKNPMYGKKGKLCPHYGKKMPPSFSETIRIKNLERPVITCPFCKKSSKNIGTMNMWHFDNCKENPNNTINYIKCPHCNFITRSISNIKRYHLDNCKFKQKS